MNVMKPLNRSSEYTFRVKFERCRVMYHSFYVGGSDSEGVGVHFVRPLKH